MREREREKVTSGHGKPSLNPSRGMWEEHTPSGVKRSELKRGGGKKALGKMHPCRVYLRTSDGGLKPFVENNQGGREEGGRGF